MSGAGESAIERCSRVPPTEAIVPQGQTNPKRSYRLAQQIQAGHDLDMGIGPIPLSASIPQPCSSAPNRAIPSHVVYSRLRGVSGPVPAPWSDGGNIAAGRT